MRAMVGILVTLAAMSAVATEPQLVTPETKAKIFATDRYGNKQGQAYTVKGNKVYATNRSATRTARICHQGQQNPRHRPLREPEGAGVRREGKQGLCDRSVREQAGAGVRREGRQGHRDRPVREQARPGVQGEGPDAG